MLKYILIFSLKFHKFLTLTEKIRSVNPLRHLQHLPALYQSSHNHPIPADDSMHLQ